MRASVLLILGVGIFLVGSKAEAQSPQTAERAQAINHALRTPDGLHKAALLEGGAFTQTLSYVPWVRHASLLGLAKESELIVAVVVESNKCVLVQDGRGIETRYVVQVETTFMGKAVPGARETVALIGGRFKFLDGSVVQVDAPNQPRLLNGRRYVLYLKRTEDGDFAPTGLDEGMFRLAEDDTVKPHATGRGAALNNEAHYSHKEFFARVWDSTNGKDSGAPTQ